MSPDSGRRRGVYHRNLDSNRDFYFGRYYSINSSEEGEDNKMRKISFISFAILFLLFNLKAFGQNDGLDQLQTQYLMKLDKIVRDLQNSQHDVITLRSKQLEYAKAENSKAYLEINPEIKKAELLQVALEKEAKDLQTGALKYYKGNLPKELNNEWRKREKKMLDDKLNYTIKNAIISNEINNFLKRKGLLK
jgi:hypothetical protein